MNEEHISLILDNLLGIYNSSSTFVHKRELKCSDGAVSVSLDELVAFLIDSDFVEHDNDPDKFYLTPETYELIDSGEIESQVWVQLSISYAEEGDSHYDDAAIAKKSELNEAENEIDEKQTKRRGKGIERILYLVLGLLVSYIYFNATKNETSTEAEKFYEELEEILEDVVVIDENGDALKFEKTDH